MPLEGFFRFPIQLAFVLLLAITAWAWGEALLCRLFPGPASGVDLDDEDEEANEAPVGPEPLPEDEVPAGAQRWAFSAALGLGLIGQGLFFLGLSGLFEPLPLALFFVVGHVAAVAAGAWRNFGRMLGAISGQVALLGFATLPTWVISFYPPMGFDATVYHLPYAKRFLELGGLAFLPELRFPVFPQLGELLFVPGMLWAGDEAAQITQAFSFFLGAAVVWTWGRWRGDFAVAYLSTALWLGLPIAVWIGGQAYVDLSLALFVAAGAAAWDRWRLEEIEGDDDAEVPAGQPVRWLFVAGLFLGFAAATKYLGLYFLVALAVMTVRARRRRGLAFAAGALVVALPWYLRNIWLTGNPLFPFYTALFGDNEWTTLHDTTLGDAAPGGLAADLAVRVFGGLGDLLTLPFDALFRRHLFHFEAPLSPWYLLLVPLALYAPFARRRRHSVRRWLGVVLVFGLLWLTTVRELRFWLPALAVFHLAVALTLTDVLERHVRQEQRRWGLIILLGAAFVAPGWLYGFHKVSDLGKPPIEAEERQTYFDALVPGHAAIHHMEVEHGDDFGVYALHGEHLRHYADGRFRGDWFGPDRFAILRPLLGTPQALAAELEARHLDHLLVHRLEGVDVADVDESERFERVMESGDFVLYHVLPPSPPAIADPTPPAASTQRNGST